MSSQQDYLRQRSQNTDPLRIQIPLFCMGSDIAHRTLNLKWCMQRRKPLRFIIFQQYGITPRELSPRRLPCLPDPKPKCYNRPRDKQPLSLWYSFPSQRDKVAAWEQRHWKSAAPVSSPVHLDCRFFADISCFTRDLSGHTLIGFQRQIRPWEHQPTKL